MQIIHLQGIVSNGRCNKQNAVSLRKFIVVNKKEPMRSAASAPFTGCLPQPFSHFQLSRESHANFSAVPPSQFPEMLPENVQLSVTTMPLMPFVKPTVRP
jgi:hypothetical protein